MNKSNSNMEALSQQIKHNNHWRWVGLIAVLGVFVIGATVGLAHYWGYITNIIVNAIASAAAFVNKWLTSSNAKVSLSLLAFLTNLAIFAFSILTCVKVVDERSKFFNNTAVKWGREWLLESHDFRNDKAAHQLFYAEAIVAPVATTLLTTTALSETPFILKAVCLMSEDSNGFPLMLVPTNRAIAISFGLAVLIKLGATIWHMFFQYSLKEYPQAFIDKVKHDIDGNPYDALEPVISSVWSSPVPLTVVWSILQMPPERSEKDN